MLTPRSAVTLYVHARSRRACLACLAALQNSDSVRLEDMKARCPTSAQSLCVLIGRVQRDGDKRQAP